MTHSKTKLIPWLAPVVIIAVTVAVFFPALRNGFVDLDDDMSIVGNPYYRGLGWMQLRWMFSTFLLGHYQPLTWMTLGLDYLVWGMNPFGYHLTSLILHALNAVVFYFLCVRLLSLSVASGNLALRVSAAIAALLFAIHPLRVESVVWATERRDVLSGLFFLLTVLWYIKAATAETEASRRKRMALAVAVYVMSLLSKAVGMSLPAVLLVLDIYPLKRLGGGKGRWFGPDVRWVWWEKLPFVLLAGGAGWLAVLAQHRTGAMVSLANYGMFERQAQVFYNLAFYVWKTLMPVGLSPLIEIPWNFDPSQWVYVGSALAVVAVTWTVFFFRAFWPAGLAVWVYYAAMVLPVSGIAQSGAQLVADRYSYLSCLGWAILIGGGLLFLWERRPGRIPTASAYGSGAIIVAVMAGLGFLTWQQTKVWHDSEKLFSYILAVNPRSKVAHNNFGNILFNRGQVDEAIKHYRRALQVDPYYTFVHFNLAEALSAQGKLDEATKHYREAIRLPGSMKARVAAYTGLGLLLNNQGKADQAIKSYRQALELDPTFNPAHVNLGDVLSARGEFDEAIAQFQQAIQNEPDSALAHHRWGNALLGKGDLEGAMEHYRRTLEIEPRNAEVLTNLGSILGARGEDEAAMNHYREALKTDPNYGPAHFNLGVLLGERGKTQEAIEHFRNVVEKNPRDAGGHFYLGRYLAMEGKAEEAAIHFKAVLQIQPGFSEAKESLKRLTTRQKKN